MTCFVCRETPAPDGHACRRCAQVIAHEDKLNQAYAVLDDQQCGGGWDTSDTLAWIETLEQQAMDLKR